MEPQKHSASTKVRKFLPLRFAGLSFKIPWLLGPRHAVWKLLMSHWTHILLLYWDNDTETYQAVPPSTWNQTAAFLRVAGLIPPEQVGVGKPDDSPPPGATPRFLRWDCVLSSVLLSIKILVGEWLIVSDSSAFKGPSGGSDASLDFLLQPQRHPCWKGRADGKRENTEKTDLAVLAGKEIEGNNPEGSQWGWPELPVLTGIWAPWGGSHDIINNVHQPRTYRRGSGQAREAFTIHLSTQSFHQHPWVSPPRDYLTKK